MNLIPLGRLYDFMGARRLFMSLSLAAFFAALVGLFAPGLGLRLGTDFKGGTEVEIAFTGQVSSSDVENAVKASGFSHPDVIRVDDANNANHYIVRVQEVSTISPEKQAEVEKSLCAGEGQPADTCTPNRTATEVKFSPGGDKITVRFREAPDMAFIRAQIAGVGGLMLRPGANNPSLQSERDNKVEIQLMSKGDQLMAGLRDKLGADKVPVEPLRSEWIGPKAGAQLRDAALKAVLISIVFIMAYIAFRFDLRFAPGAVFAMVHDAVTVLGFLVLVRREVNLTTVAAILTVVGYSINDTVIVYDRVRENLGRLRGRSFQSLVNLSVSEMLNRTLLASGTTIISLTGLFFFGTGTLKDFALTLIVGITLGTYSSIYVALPLTDWLDHTFFAKVGKGKKKIGQSRKAEAPAV
ncbi:MAG: protein translocase subunit SecF [Polyangiaceae bacterium]|nr:protein translocase subunit SecF [Polyangiaceae bacterium]